MIVKYERHLKPLSRSLRNDPTWCERLLWSQLRGRQIRNYQFTRQKPIGSYIVDFYCPALELVIEVDGYTHEQPGTKERDKQRDAFLNGSGLSVLRFRDEAIQQNMDLVLCKIEETLMMLEKEKGLSPPVPRVRRQRRKKR